MESRITNKRSTKKIIRGYLISIKVSHATLNEFYKKVERSKDLLEHQHQMKPGCEDWLKRLNQ